MPVTADGGTGFLGKAKVVSLWGGPPDLRILSSRHCTWQVLLALSQKVTFDLIAKMFDKPGTVRDSTARNNKNTSSVQHLLAAVGDTRDWCDADHQTE